MGKHKIVKGKDFSWIKRYYLNGRLSLFGSSNIYAVWNGFVYMIYRTVQKKWGNTHNK